MFQLKSVLFAISLFTIINADNCQISKCSDPEKHVLCLYEHNSTGSSCDTVDRTSITADEKMKVLSIHDYIRKHVDPENKLPPLQWDEELEEMAQRWSNQCLKINDECRSLEKYSYPVQQNIAEIVQIITSVPSEDINLAKEIVEWYNLPNNPVHPENHPSKTFDRIGCGMTVTSKIPISIFRPAHYKKLIRYYFVCNYASTK